MRDDVFTPSYRVVIVGFDRHAEAACDRVCSKLQADFPGLVIETHASAEWAEDPSALEAAKAAVATADIIVANLIFFEDQVKAIKPALEARRDHCDALLGVISDAEIVNLTKMGDLDLSKPASGAMKFLKKLRGSKKPTDCRLFATACTPESPLGSCMVSDEGACAAYFTYGRFREQALEQRARERAGRRERRAV